MCGITGAVWNDPAKALEPETLQRMIAVLRHRGPDDEGEYVGLRAGHDGVPGVALGHRRLAIIDVAGGQQPLSNEDGTVWIVFNGEIYNFRASCGAGWKAPATASAPKRHRNLVHLYEDEGPRVPGASQRHVRPGPVGRPAAATAAGPRPPGRKAAGLSRTSRAGCCSPAS